MDLDASLYIRERKLKTAIVDSSISRILKYIVDCYLLFKKDCITYTKDEKGKIFQEDYFRDRLVDDYLRKNKSLIPKSQTTEIWFNKEATETYIDNKGVKHNDKIDIRITDTALQKSWNLSNTDDVYYALECKRIKTTSNITDYIGDIVKFTERKYLSTRLPFEGQVAFIENTNLSGSKLIQNINLKLKKHTTINTKQFLASYKVHTDFEDSYLSQHSRSQTKEVFSINHLLFDYSDVLV